MQFNTHAKYYYYSQLVYYNRMVLSGRNNRMSAMGNNFMRQGQVEFFVAQVCYFSRLPQLTIISYANTAAKVNTWNLRLKYIPA